MFWSTISPIIDLSEELSKEDKFKDVIRTKHNANSATNVTIIIEASNNKLKPFKTNKKTNGFEETLLKEFSSQEKSNNG